jgi:hypothetical protein
MITVQDYIRVTLRPDQIDWCIRQANRRQNNAVTRGRMPMNGAPTNDEEARFLHMVGFYGEMAGNLYLIPKVWNFFKDGDLRGLPDYEDWIDMKTNKRRYSVNHLIVQRSDPPHWAYILSYPDPHPTYCMVGWCFGCEARCDDYFGELSRGRPAYNVPHTASILKPMRLLWGMVRREQW